jgi:hypothetical protein
MATSSEKLATSLEVLKELQDRNIIAIRSADISRTHKERLITEGFLQEVMKGWYIPARADETTGESTAWFTSYWDFCAAYLTERFGENWSLSPEQSIQLHAGNRTVPTQLLVRATNARNQITSLMHGTSIFEVRASLPEKQDILIDDHGLRFFSLSAALINSFENFYARNPVDTKAALATFSDASTILEPLLKGGRSVVAGRIAGAFRNIGRDTIANDILNGMRAAGYNVREQDPFQYPVVLHQRETSPYINRLRLMWQNMRGKIIDNFPPAPGLPKDKDKYLKQVADNYAEDAYNSLSIEGYRVNAALIERVRTGQWHPDTHEQDRQQRDAMAARGYWQAYKEVLKSIEKILNGDNAGRIANHDHATWYREMFSPSVTAGILKASDLAGYRNHPVYIRRSQHIPPNSDAVRELMPAFFELLANEEHASVRIVLGHFAFVYIHPYMDGNGRISRFLMNTMMASGGYPWTVIPLERREEYMAALEAASAKQDIEPFTKFIADLL